MVWPTALWVIIQNGGRTRSRSRRFTVFWSRIWRPRSQRNGRIRLQGTARDLPVRCLSGWGGFVLRAINDNLVLNSFTWELCRFSLSLEVGNPLQDVVDLTNVYCKVWVICFKEFSQTSLEERHLKASLFEVHLLFCKTGQILCLVLKKRRWHWPFHYYINTIKMIKNLVTQMEGYLVPE